MKIPPRYEAFWLPGLDEDVDPDEVLAIAFGWLRSAERKHGGTGILVMNAVQMRGNRPILSTAPWDIVSPRSRRPHGRGPVLAVWPEERTLELAEMLALDSALCAMAGTLFDIAPWIRRSGAACLVEGFEVARGTELPAEISRSLDHMLFFGGHNSFLGGGEKEDAIRRLREIARRPDAPPRDAIVEYLRSTGETDADGAERVGKWYEEIQLGKRHLDYARRVI